MYHIFSYQQSNSLKSSFTSWWSFFIIIFLFCSFFDYAGIVVIIVLTLQDHYECSAYVTVYMLYKQKC